MYWFQVRVKMQHIVIHMLFTISRSISSDNCRKIGFKIFSDEKKHVFGSQPLGSYRVRLWRRRSLFFSRFLSTSKCHETRAISFRSGIKYWFFLWVSFTAFKKSIRKNAAENEEKRSEFFTKQWNEKKNKVGILDAYHERVMAKRWWARETIRSAVLSPEPLNGLCVAMTEPLSLNTG